MEYRFVSISLYVLFVFLAWLQIANSQGPCRDAFDREQCAILALAGRCRTNRQDMLITCPLTCRFCEAEGQLPCEDVSTEFCANYFALGLCERLKEALLAACSLTCSWCTRRGTWGAWGSWSGCTASCGAGTSIRTRRCNTGRNEDCSVQQHQEARFCNTQSCLADGLFTRFTEWSLWGSCSRTCGPGSNVRTRRCLSRANGNQVTACTGRQLENRDCYLRRCPTLTVYNWQPWNSWSRCSLSCDTGSSFRTRACSVGGQRNCGPVWRETRVCNAFPCRIVTAWNNWYPWTDCSRICGVGLRSRTRDCSSGTTTECGSLNSQSEQCNVQPCTSISWELWQSWSTCSEPCGRGSRSRFRLCSTRLALDCGTTNQETEQCNLQPCLPSTWLTWNPWGSCSATCGPGGQIRNRQCSSGRVDDCPGTLRAEARPCNEQRCPTIADPSWNQWQSWRACSAPCGGGTRTRHRLCSSGQGCGSLNRQSEQCNIHDCPEIAWTTWTQWGRCTKSCGDGQRTRRRTCNTGRTADCGVMSELTLTYPCNTNSCPFSFIWNEWTQWTVCTLSCGGGTRRRSRTCPTNRNEDCGTLSGQHWRCNTHSCVRSGSWNAWNGWTTCSRSCNGGTRTRTRTCGTGRNSDCGNTVRQTVNCNTRTCQRWNSWNGWSTCSRSCGEGSRTRTRTCSSGRDSDCGSVTSQTSSCNRQRCPPWNSWNGWSRCSRTCGEGTRTRTRTCSTGNNRDCGSSPTQTSSCNARTCPASSWNRWSPWSRCSRSCGEGVITRSRSCSLSNTISCGVASSQSLPCNIQDCPIPSTWNNWGAWSSCSSSCAGGTTIRRRSCSSGNNLDCGLAEQQSLPCNTNSCPIDDQWSDWLQWSACDVSCGAGRRLRSRICEGSGCQGDGTVREECVQGPCLEECSCPEEEYEDECSDDEDGSCQLFAPHCSIFPTYAESRCPLSCGLCPISRTNNDDCECDEPNPQACPTGEIFRYNSTRCCVVESSKSCGLNSFSERIIGGEAAMQGRWPWMIFVTTPISFCGATLISSRWAVSAAHCFANQQANSINLCLGFGSRLSRNYTARRLIIHPLFRINVEENILENDIALLELPVDVPVTGSSIRPICLPEGEAVPNERQCFVAGWGVTSPDSLVPSRVLMQASFDVVSNSECRTVYNFLRPYMLCAGGRREGVDTCSGDSGGPLMCQMCRSCAWYIVGITSFGPRQCGTLGQPGVYTRITSFEEWISELTGINLGTPSTCF